MTFLITFIILSIINVVFSTVRSIATIKSGKTVASLLSGGYFAFYNIMLIYTVADFPMWEKCLITFICNVVGVWIVKFIEEKLQKDKLWRIELTVRNSQLKNIINFLNSTKIPYSAIEEVTNKYTILNVYCATQKESLSIKELVTKFNVKYFVSESKIL